MAPLTAQSSRKIEIIPFLRGGSLLRLSASPHEGIVVALGGEPVEFVVATDMSLQFLQVTETPNYVFRVYEKAGAAHQREHEWAASLRSATPPPQPRGAAKTRDAQIGTPAETRHEEGTADGWAHSGRLLSRRSS